MTSKDQPVTSDRPDPAAPCAAPETRIRPGRGDRRVFIGWALVVALFCLSALASLFALLER